MKTIKLFPLPKYLSISLLLCLFCSAMAVQGQTINGWISTASSGSARNMSVVGNWSQGRAPLAGDVLVFGYTNTPGVGVNGSRNPINNLTNWSTYPVSLVFSNTDGWRITVPTGGYTNKFTLGAGGIFQDASVTNTTPAGQATVGRNEFYNYFELSANSSIVNNSLYSFINFRQDGSMFTAGNMFCLDNKGYTLTFDGPGTNAFQTPSAGTHTGGAIKGSGGVIKNGSGLTSLSSSNAYTGPTLVNAGQLAIYTYSYGGGSYGVSNNASLSVRVAYAGSTLNTSSLSLTNTTGAANTNTLILNLSNLGNPTAPVIYATNLTVVGTVYVTVTGSGFSPGTIPLIKYNGSFNGGGSLVTNSIPTGVAAYLTNNTSAQQIQLVVSSVPSLVWTGKTNNVLAGTWDIGVTTNWNDTAALQPTTFLNGLPVQFDDTGSTNLVVLATNVAPFSLTVSNNAKTYTLTNDGINGFQVNGTARIVKDGPGKFILATTNSYSGFTYVKQGTLQLAAATAIGSSSVVTNNATLDLNGFSQNFAALDGTGLVTNSTTMPLSLTLLASAADGGTWGGQINEGAGKITLYKSGGMMTLTGNNNYSGGTHFITGGSTVNRVVILGGNNVLGTGDFYWDNIGGTLTADASPRTMTNAIHLNVSSAILGNPGAGLLTLAGPVILDYTTDSGLTLNSDVTISSPAFNSTAGYGIGNISGPGTLTLQNMTCNVTNFSSTWYQLDGNVVIDGAAVSLNNSDYRIQDQGASGITRLIVTNGGSLTIATAGKDLKIGYTSASPSSTNIADISGILNVARYVQVGTTGALAVLDLNTGGTIVAGQIRGAGAPSVMNINGGTLQPNGYSSTLMQGLTNVYILGGGMIVDTGTNSVHIAQDLLNGGGGGGLLKLGAATLQLDGANTYTGTTTISNGTLAGVGMVSGPVIVTAAGSFKPANVGAIGTFTISNNLTLQAGSVFGVDVNKDASPSNDLAVVTGQLNYGGTLNISTNLLTGTPLALGDTFPIVSAGSYTGSIAVSQTYSSPGDGLAWFFDPATGNLSVVNLSYTVAFDGQGGTAPSPTSITATNGLTYGTLATTTRVGYTFGGWWTGAGGTGTQITSASTVALAGNQTLYAKWTSSAPPTLGVSQTGSTLHFSWTGTFKLQSQTNALSAGLGSNWGDYPGGGSSPVDVTINPANPTVFFRLSQ